MPYSMAPPEELTLRDVLARDRTVLANERTLLAYLRTGLMLLVSGVTLFKLSVQPGVATWTAALVLGAAGVLISTIGLARFFRVARALAKIPG